MYKRREIKYVAMVLLTVMPLSLWAQVEKQVDEEYDKGYAQGHADGEKVDQRDWGLYGIGGGCLGCFLGGAAVWQAAARSGDTPEHVPEGTSEFKKKAERSCRWCDWHCSCGGDYCYSSFRHRYWPD